MKDTGRIKLPRGKTANDRAKKKAKFPSNSVYLKRQAGLNPDELINPVRVNVFMEGGVIHNIEVPEGVEVQVYNYDIEGLDKEIISQDVLGDPCTITTWSHDDED